MIQVKLPGPLRLLAQIDGEVWLEVSAPVTQRTLLDELERRYPPLLGTLRDAHSGKRRDFIRFFAEGQDLSHQSPDDPLPESVTRGQEPYLVVGAIAGG
ncbi:MoaD/ThiS family protein [bacterium]|nr:MoaD/ThiS family protein [bacterium]